MRIKREGVGVEGDLSRFETFSAYVRDLLGAVAGKGSKRRTAGPLWAMGCPSAIGHDVRGAGYDGEMARGIGARGNVEQK